MSRLVLILMLLPWPFLSGICQVPYFQQYFLLKKSEPVHVNTIYQDRTGFMWIGTTKNLFRFDGKNHFQYGKEQNLLLENITAIAQDSLGRIWIGDGKGSISFLEDGKFQPFETNEGIPTEGISDILFDKHGNLWFGTYNDGLYYYVNNRLYRLDKEEGMPDLYVYDLAEDKNGNIWIGTDGGVAICKLSGAKTTINVIDYEDSIPDNIVKKIIPESENLVWLATEDAGILSYNPITMKFKSLINSEWKYGSISDFVLREDKIWISCPQQGLLIYNKNTGQLILHPPEIVQGQGLLSIQVLHKDAEENIWVGSKYGLLRTPGDNLEFIEHFKGLETMDVLAITVDHQDNIWFSNKEGLHKLRNFSNGVIENPLANTPYSKYTVISLYTDTEGFVWAGLYGEGVLRLDTKTGKIKYFNSEIRNGNILSISGIDKSVWLATLGGATQITFENEKYIVKNFSSSDGLISDFIYQVYPEKSKVWFATDGKGLAMKDEYGFHNYDKGLTSKVIYSIAKDSKDRLWVNVQNDGLFRLEGDIFYPADSSLFVGDAEIQILTTDRYGNLLAVHGTSLNVIETISSEKYSLSINLELHDKTANLNSVGKDKDGNIFLGTDKGIIKYSDQSNFQDRKPLPKIENVKVFDQVVNDTKLQHLNYDDNNITIDFLGFWYQDPSRINFQYRLVDYDRDWISTKNNAVTYSSLPPGSYTFHLKVSDSDRFADSNETSISFTIHKPFWETISFYTISGVLIIALGYSFIKYRESKLRNDKVILEHLIQDRTIEIIRQKNEIEKRNNEIIAKSAEIIQINENLEQLVKERTGELESKNKALEDYAFINAHKLRSPVASILGLINLIIKTKLDDEGKEICNHLKSSSNQLDDVVTSITQAIERGDKLIP